MYLCTLAGFTSETSLNFHALEITFICLHNLSKTNFNTTPVEINEFLAPQDQNYVFKLEVIQGTAKRGRKEAECLAREEMQDFSHASGDSK